jgi:hypothetical protein
MPDLTAKEKAVQAMETLPDEASLDDAIERLIFLQKIERGRAQRAAGEGISQEDVEGAFGVSWRAPAA